MQKPVIYHINKIISNTNKVDVAGEVDATGMITTDTGVKIGNQQVINSSGEWIGSPYGLRGYTGSQGIQGIIGYTGSRGLDGYVGADGATGYTGSQGIQGIIGYTGSKGDIGYTGSQGIQGNIGYTGSKGDIGYIGSQGIQGIIGYTGSKGDSGLGFIIAKTYISVAALLADTSPTGIISGQFAIIENGNVNDPENSRLYLWNGTVYTYISDLSGAQGITGPQGNIGYTGSQGIIGYTGSQGVQGIIGYTGSQGTQGIIGYTGSQGVTGYTGSLGYTGSQGNAGPNNIINSTNDTATTALYPVMVDTIGSPVTPKSNSSAIVVNASTGNVGIGAAASTYKLVVTGASRFISDAANAGGGSISLGTSGSNNRPAIGIGSTSNPEEFKIVSVGDWRVGSTISRPLSLITNSIQRLYIDTNGNVGIGNILPTQILDVTGNATLRNSTTATNFYAHNTYTDASNYERAKIGWNANVLEIGSEALGTGSLRNIRLIGGNVGIGTGTPGYKLQLFDSTASTPVTASIVTSTNSTAALYLGDTATATMGRVQYDNNIDAMQLFTNNLERLRIDVNGNIGINTTTTLAKLDVNGTVRYTNGTSGTKIAGPIYNYNWFGSNGALQAYKIATLPTSSGSTLEHIVIEGVMGGWTNSDKNNFKLHATNRGGLIVNYQMGTGHSIQPQQAHIDFYTEADGSVSVWAVLDVNTFSMLSANITVAYGDGAFLTYPNPANDTPTGTLSYSTKTSVPTLYITNSGSLGVGTTATSAKLDVVGDIEVNTNTRLYSESATLATITKTQIASFVLATFRSAKLLVQIYDSVTGAVQISEILIAHNGTTPFATEYGVVYTGAAALATFDVDILSTNVRLMATSASTNSTQYKVFETLMVA